MKLDICSVFSLRSEGRLVEEQRLPACAIADNIACFVRYLFHLQRGNVTAPKKQVKDRRVQKTQGLLREALVSLIHEKSYDAIAVKEILDRANVGRSTFYTHFRDKDELLVSGVHEMMHSLHSAVLPSPVTGYEKITRFSLPIFEYHDRHRQTGVARM